MCYRQYEELELVGSLNTRLTVHATDDVYNTTREKMAIAEEEHKKSWSVHTLVVYHIIFFTHCFRLYYQARYSSHFVAQRIVVVPVKKMHDISLSCASLIYCSLREGSILSHHLAIQNIPAILCELLLE